jgi:transposase-like protein
MKCRRCGEEGGVIKSGWVRGKQRWHCKDCQFHFVEQDERCKPGSLHQEVVRLYCSGLSYNRSEKLKGISHTTARRWVSQYAEGLPERPELESPVVELDEQCSFVGKKRK